MINQAVITERLLEMIAGREVKAALFTTYTFEPDFFELEVIPLLLNQEMAYSTDERVKRLMVRENLRESRLPIDVFYDLPMFRMSGSNSPEMEYQCNGVNLGNRAFHGKVNIILLRDKHTKEETLLLGAGSNNLSRAGWWDNVECQHWEEIKNRDVTRKTINFLKEDVNFLIEHCAFSHQLELSAIKSIREFVDSIKGSKSAAPIYYYGLSYIENRGTFIDFLQNRSSPLHEYSNWELEIISPFFADDAENDEHQTFFDMGVRSIKLFLPFDGDENALCQQDYYDYIKNEEDIEWAQWRKNLAHDLGVSGEYFRPLHAKVYHFYNKRQSWVFVGSVNFTYKALHENVEAGFLAKLNKSGPLLDAIEEKVEIVDFNEPEELIPGESNADKLDEKLPELHLCFDWVTKCLTGRTEKHHRYEIEIFSSENIPVITPWSIGYEESDYIGDTKDLEELLKNGSLVKVSGRNLKLKKQTEFPEHKVLLQQIGWSHKPLDLPKLTATQILAIYAGMSVERRQLMLVNAKIRALVLSAQGGELTNNNDIQIVEQFFSEYAELFNAFSKLKIRLERALDAEQYNLVDYYLTGTGVDSLTTLVSKAQDSDEENVINATTRYLILLSSLEIYNSKQFLDSPNVKNEIKKLKRSIRLFKKSDQLKLENNSAENRKQFFKWFEQEFFRKYTTVQD